MFELMFWTEANEALFIVGCKTKEHYETFDEAVAAAEMFSEEMKRRGAVEATIYNNDMDEMVYAEL